MSNFQEKVVVVTGGARGMGAATSRLFAQQGATTIICDIADTEGENLAREIGNGAVYRSLDVSDDGAWQKLVDELREGYGRVDALVNNAGVLRFCEIENLTDEILDLVFNVNVKGAVFGIKHVGKLMKSAGKGAIVNISSIDGLRGANALGAYSASKWALRGLTKVAALEYGPSGVRVNSVHPGGVDTVMGNPEGKSPDEMKDDYTMVPLQRIGNPEEIAAASVFLCSDEASYISGAELLVDGGWNAGVYHPMLPGSPTSISG